MNSYRRYRWFLASWLALAGLAGCGTENPTQVGASGAGGGGGAGGGAAACKEGESRECYLGPAATKGVGQCVAGSQSCQNGAWTECFGQVVPTAEACNGFDDDCDGDIDEGCPCAAGEEQPCYDGPAKTLGVGACKAGKQVCAAGGWGECKGQISPADDDASCNDLDDDCDGNVDEDASSLADCALPGEKGECAIGKEQCVKGAQTCVALHAPAADVTCNGKDEDCNGVPDDGAIPGVGPDALCTVPGASGACAAGSSICQNGVIVCAQTVKPQKETCNGVDDDCDGQTDEDNPDGGKPCNTGKAGACAQGIETCQGGALVCVPALQPVAEICDGQDNNCDGQIDEGNPGGGVDCQSGKPGVCAAGLSSCVNGKLTCNPKQPAVPEACDGLDNNCNGQIDDGDPEGGAPCTVPNAQGLCAAGAKSCLGGQLVCTQTVLPAQEACNGKDDDCDGVIDNGNPGSGAPCLTGQPGVCSSGTTSCQNGQPACVQSNQPVAEVCNGKDDDCDGLTDENNPGGGAACNVPGALGTCAAGQVKCQGGQLVCAQTVQPTIETCDGKDNDCNGVVDDGNPGGGNPCTVPGALGVCAAGLLQCQNGQIVCTQTATPTVETCNGKDDNCNGAIDEGDPGGGQSCSTGQPGVCAIGVTACLGSQNVCVPNSGPAAETCNGKDDDCDGLVDNGNPGGGAACSVPGAQGVCAVGTLKCTNGQLLCQSNLPAAPEICDGKDNDCNGVIDDNNPGGGGLCATGLPGVCATGVQTCLGGSLQCNPTVIPGSQAEVCDGKDNNCNGSIDDGNPGGGQACNTGKPGICAAGTTSCAGGALTCASNLQATAEVCDGLDNNCDGVADNGNPGGGAPCTVPNKAGVCAAGTITCTSGALTCAQNLQPSNEICGDGKDNDCDGLTDEGC